MPDKVEGVLEVGRNDNHEVVVNHPDLKPDANGVGHIVFSVNQARSFAETLLKQADYAAARVYQMDDEECYAAESLDQALKEMAETCGYNATPEEIEKMREEFGVEDPHELTEEDLRRRTIRIGDPDEDDDITVTFREYLDQLVAGKELPCLFSSTEY